MALLKHEGIIAPIITPFTERGELDKEGLRQNIEFLVKNGVRGVITSGTTGEAESLTREERRLVLSVAIDQMQGRFPVIAGTGAPSTRAAMELTKDAEKEGADAALVVTPFYHTPTEEALIRHYELLGKEVGLPIVVYNIPQHTNVNVSPSILHKLADQVDAIKGFKDSSGNMGQFSETIRLLGDRISIFTGADDLLLPSLVLGARGAMIAVGNVTPRIVADIYDLVMSGEIEKARVLFLEWLPLARACTLSSYNFPVAVKDAVGLVGRPSGPPRSPLAPSSKAELEAIRQALRNLGFSNS